MTDIVVIALSLGLEKYHMMRCYGDMVVNPTGGAVRMNFGFAPTLYYIFVNHGKFFYYVLQSIIECGYIILMIKRRTEYGA